MRCLRDQRTSCLKEKHLRAKRPKLPHDGSLHVSTPYPSSNYLPSPRRKTSGRAGSCREHFVLRPPSEPTGRSPASHLKLCHQLCYNVRMIKSCPATVRLTCALYGLRGPRGGSFLLSLPSAPFTSLGRPWRQPETLNLKLNRVCRRSQLISAHPRGNHNPSANNSPLSVKAPKHATTAGRKTSARQPPPSRPVFCAFTPP